LRRTGRAGPSGSGRAPGRTARRCPAARRSPAARRCARTGWSGGERTTVLECVVHGPPGRGAVDLHDDRARPVSGDLRHRVLEVATDGGAHARLVRGDRRGACGDLQVLSGGTGPPQERLEQCPCRIVVDDGLHPGECSIGRPRAQVQSEVWQPARPAVLGQCEGGVCDRFGRAFGYEGAVGGDGRRAQVTTDLQEVGGRPPTRCAGFEVCLRRPKAGDAAPEQLACAGAKLGNA